MDYAYLCCFWMYFLSAMKPSIIQDQCPFQLVLCKCVHQIYLTIDTSYMYKTKAYYFWQELSCRNTVSMFKKICSIFFLPKNRVGKQWHVVYSYNFDCTRTIIIFVQREKFVVTLKISIVQKLQETLILKNRNSMWWHMLFGIHLLIEVWWSCENFRLHSKFLLLKSWENLHCFKLFDSTAEHGFVQAPKYSSLLNKGLLSPFPLSEISWHV